MAKQFNTGVRPLIWQEEGLLVLDQRRLPKEVLWRPCRTAFDVAEAIRNMEVRGAPAIGIAAAYGVVLSARQRFREDPEKWRALVEEDLRLLAASRPTAVNLFWALSRMRRKLEEITEENPYPLLLREAQVVEQMEREACLAMGRLGAEVIGKARGVLTHCNTGALATCGIGTALGVIRTLYRQAPCAVYATETRPWLQGARLTLWELTQDQIPTTLIVDSAAAFLMRQGKVEWVIVGADRIAQNGDVANKIGTLTLALAAKAHDVKFMVVAPTSTIDWEIPSGEAIPIETRPLTEVLPEAYRDHSQAEAWNPVFDLTPAELIDAVVTEKGVVLDPSRGGLGMLRKPPREGAGPHAAPSA